MKISRHKSLSFSQEAGVAMLVGRPRRGFYRCGMLATKEELIFVRGPAPDLLSFSSIPIFLDILGGFFTLWRKDKLPPPVRTSTYQRAAWAAYLNGDVPQLRQLLSGKRSMFYWREAGICLPWESVLRIEFADRRQPLLNGCCITLEGSAHATTGALMHLKRELWGKQHERGQFRAFVRHCHALMRQIHVGSTVPVSENE